MIPKKIHQILIVDGLETPTSLPDQYKHAMDSWKLMNPGYEYTMYNGMDCKRFIKEHYNKRYLRLFNKIRPYAFKCDFVRMLILNKVGGWYADSRQVCLAKLDILESLGREFYSSMSVPPNNYYMCNSFVGVIPEHPIIKKYIEMMCWNIENDHYGGEPLWPTGPALFIQAAVDYVRRNRDKTVIGNQVRGKIPHQEFIVYDNKPFVLRKYNNAKGADNSDLEGTNNYGDMWKNWDVYTNGKGDQNSNTF